MVGGQAKKLNHLVWGGVEEFENFELKVNSFFSV